MSPYTKFDPANPPPPLMTGEPNSFAHRTMTTRIPANLQKVIETHAHEYPPAILQALQNLYDEIVEGQPLRPLETTAPDQASWTEAWQRYQGRSWLDVPWYFAEAFFYRRLLEATNYFGDSPEVKRIAAVAGNPEAEATLERWAGSDPFLPTKQAELQSEAPWQVLKIALDHSGEDSTDSFQALLHHCVWGNRIDLSYTAVFEASGRDNTLEEEQANLLVDDTGIVANHLQPLLPRSQPSPTPNPQPLAPPRIDFICDNAGTELILDLALADFLLRCNWVEQITLHVKAHPTFVSDAIPADVTMSIEAIKAQPAASFKDLGKRLANFRADKRLLVVPHLFWNSHRFFWEIPAALRAELAQAHLVIIKGDANYRRLLGDSRWPATVPVEDAIPYFPAPFVTLRTMKSDPVVGLKPGQAETLDQEDPEWRVNGQRGLIQTIL